MIDAAKKFLEELKDNEEVKNVLASIETEGKDELAVLVEAAKKLGYDVEADDFAQLQDSIRTASDEAIGKIAEIGEEQMEKVAGGSCDGFMIPGCDGIFSKPDCKLGKLI